MKRTIARASVLIATMLLAFPVAALASDVNVAVVDVTAPTGSVTLSPGGSGAITINLSVTGNQAGTATFEVYRNWTLSGGTFSGSNPQEFTVAPRAGGDPATTFATSGNVSVASGEAGGTFTLSVGVFDITNTNTTGAKLAAGANASYVVTVETPTDPCLSVTAPVAPSITPNPILADGLGGWWVTVPTVSATTTTAGATITYATEANGGAKSGYTATAPTLVQGTTIVYAKATSATCSKVSESSATYLVDTIAPTVSPASVVNSTWRNTDLAQSFTASDAGSDLADAADASFTLTASAESANASTPTVVSRTVYDVAGNSTTRSVSALIDKTAPAVTPGDVIDSTWGNTAVSEDFVASDVLSGLAASGDASFTLTASAESADGSTPTVDSRTVYDVAGNSTTRSVSALIDRTAPTITDEGVYAGTEGANDWYVSKVTNEFKATDTLSGVPSGTNPIRVDTGTDEGTGIKVNSGAVTDNAGNQAQGIDSATFDIDLGDPTNIAFVGGPAAGGNYYFGGVPNAPTCTADDTVSGLASCVVTGHGTGVGSHTMTATATDIAGRTATATRTYSVLAWTLRGFYQPVDMGMLNTVKGGSTVPMKFNIFAGTTEIKTTGSVSFFKYKETSCSLTEVAGIDDIEQVTSGGTVLRYDSTGGQFVQNWQTPKTTGKCYVATLGTADGGAISAYFKTK